MCREEKAVRREFGVEMMDRRRRVVPALQVQQLGGSKWGAGGPGHLTLRSRSRGFPTSGRVMSFLVPWLQLPEKKSAKTP